MRILLLSPIYPPDIGGPATYAQELSERLTPEHTLTVIAYTTNTAVSYGSARLIQISKSAPLVMRLFAFFRAAYQEGKNADVIYAQNPVAAGLPAVLAGMLIRKPVVIKFVGDEAWERATQARETSKRLEEFLIHPEGSWYTLLIMRIEGWVLRHAAVVTTPSKYLCEALISAYRIQREKAVPNYNAVGEYGDPKDSAIAPHQLFVAARLTAWKGVDGVLRALTLVQKRFPDATLIIAGDGPERPRLEILARELNLASSVTFLGTVSHKKVLGLLSESELFILNSTYEGLPHTILDAFATRRGVVATEIPGTNEAVENGVSGLTVPPGDDAKLAEAIMRMFDEPALVRHLIEGGSATLGEQFSWRRHIENLLYIFESAQQK